jgi:hypothetical protein
VAGMMVAGMMVAGMMVVRATRVATDLPRSVPRRGASVRRGGGRALTKVGAEHPYGALAQVA